jgi:hypothetical protein
LTPIAATALLNIVPLMRVLVRSPQATFSYEMMSGALVWSDELPEFRVLRLVHHWQVMRLVLRFRTTLILGEPDEELREYWDEAQQLFPEWPGFDRRRRSSGLREALRNMESRANAELDEIVREMDQEAGNETTSG